MIILFGWTTKGATERPLIDTHCYNCRRVSTWDWYRVTEWMTAFFVRVVPVKSDYFLLCRGCNDHVQLEKDEVKGIRHLHQLPPEESKALHDRLVERLELHQFSNKSETQREYLKSQRK